MPLPPFLSRGPSFLMDLSAEGEGGGERRRTKPILLSLLPKNADEMWREEL